MITSIRELNAGYRTRSEAEIVENLRDGAVSLLTLMERWPADGKLSAVSAAGNTVAGLDRLVRELRLAQANERGAA